MANENVLARSSSDMQRQLAERWDRRKFVGSMAALAGSAGLFSYDPGPASAEPPPETTRLRIFDGPPTCLAAQYIAEELLHAEGFADVRYVRYPNGTRLWPPEVLLSGEADISFSFPPQDITHIDSGAPVVILAGIPAVASR